MDRELVSEKLWEIIEPLLPPEPSKDKGGRPRIPARAVLCGTIYVLKAGIPWRRLPKQLGYGSGVTCWRRLRDWQKAGVFVLLFRTLLDRLGRCGAIDWSRACVDSATVPAKKGSEGRA
jgi:transposase